MTFFQPNWLTFADSTNSVDEGSHPADTPGMKVVVVIGDIVRSRQIPDRQAFQRHLKKTVGALSARHPDLLSPYTVTLGDEFQAVYKRADRAFRDFFMLQRMLHPHRIRLVIGVGALTTPLNPRMSIGMDGPVFHLARQGMGELKQSGSLLRVMMAGADGTAWINPTLDLLSHLTIGWKQNRLEVLQRMLDGEDPQAIAHAMKLTPAAVYKNIQAGALNTILTLCGEITRAIEGRLKAG
jgi:hypothetical protein